VVAESGHGVGGCRGSTPSPEQGKVMVVIDDQAIEKTGALKQCETQRRGRKQQFDASAFPFSYT
jgi:hypothetical protein